MGLGDSVNLTIELVMGFFIVLIFFSALAPTIIEYINNNSTSIGMPQATILIFSLIVLAFIIGGVMKVWKSFTEPDRSRMEYP